MRERQKKPPHSGGGGGGGNLPPATGTIYYETISSWALSADGSGVVELPDNVSGEPSQSTPNNHRWFLRGGITGVTNEDGQAMWQLIAVRDDNLITTTLTNSSSIDVAILASIRWVGGLNAGTVEPDLEIAFVSHVRDGNGEIAGSRLLVATVEFDSAGIPILGSQPTTLLDDVTDFHFSPDGELVVFEDEESLYVLDRTTGTVSPLVIEGLAPETPQLSPSGMQLAYGSWENGISGIHVAQLDRDPILGIYYVTSESRIASEKLRLKGTIAGNSITSGPYWSPSGDHLTYGLQKYGSRGVEYGVIRIEKDGSNSTDLLSDDGDAVQLFVRSWR